MAQRIDSDNSKSRYRHVRIKVEAVIYAGSFKLRPRGVFAFALSFDSQQSRHNHVTLALGPRWRPPSNAAAHADHLAASFSPFSPLPLGHLLRLRPSASFNSLYLFSSNSPIFHDSGSHLIAESSEVRPS